MIYRLIENGYCIAEFRKKGDSNISLDGNLYQVNSWCGGTHEPSEYSFISNVYIKFDACSHFHFYGEDCDIDDEKSEKDSYYHICGKYGYFVFMKAIAFIYKIASTTIDGMCKDEFEDILKLNLLENCTIEEIKE